MLRGNERFLIIVRRTAFATPMVRSVKIVLRTVAPRVVTTFPMMVKTCVVLRSERVDK